jgi:hypothetical protein
MLDIPAAKELTPEQLGAIIAKLMVSQTEAKTEVEAYKIQQGLREIAVKVGLPTINF